MSDIFDEYGLEPESSDLLPYGSTPKRTSTKKKKNGGGWLGRIIAFILGIVIAFGGAYGGVYFALNRPTKEVLTLLAPWLGKDYEADIKDKLFSTKYENKTLLELPDLFSDAISKETLGALADISPFIGEYLGEMITNVNRDFGFSLDSNTIMGTKYTDLPTYLSDSLFTTPLGNILSAVNKGKPLEPMLMELCYGIEGEDYILDSKGQAKMLNGKTSLTISELVENPNESIYKLRVAPILNPGTDPLFLPMCYGKEDVTFVTQKDAEGNILVDENGNAKVTMLPMFYEKVSVTEENETREFFADYNGKEVMGTVNTKKSSTDYLYFEEKNEEGTIVDAYYLVQDPETERFYLFKPMNLSYTREGNVFTKPVYGNIIEEEDLYIHFNETDAEGNSLRQSYLVMHPDSDGLYEAFSSMDISYDKDENGEFRNENGEVVKGTILESTQYYICFAETDENDAIVRQYYLIHNTETGKYQAYDAMNMRYARTEDDSFIQVLHSEILEETEKYLVIEEKDIAGNPLRFFYLVKDSEASNKYNAYNHVYFKELTIGDLASGSDNLLNNIYLKDALKVYPTGDPETEPHKILYSLAYGTVDTSKGIYSDPRTLGDLTTNSEDIINGISVADLISPDPENAIVMYLVYGKKGVHYDIVEDKDGTVTGIELLQRRIALTVENGNVTGIYNEYGEPLDSKKYKVDLTNSTYTDNNGTVYTITKSSNPLITTKIKDADGKTVEGKKADVYFLSDAEGPLYYQASTVGDLTGEDNLLDNMMYRVTIYDVFGSTNVEGNKFLRNLGDCTMQELPDAIESLSVGEIFTSDIFVADNEETLGYHLNRGEAFTDSNRETVGTGQFYIVVEENKYFFDYFKAYGVLGLKQTIEETYGIQLYRMSDWGFYVYQNDEPFTDAEGVTIETGDFYIKSPQKDSEGKITEYLFYKFDPADAFETPEKEKDYEKEYGITLNHPGFYKCTEATGTFTDPNGEEVPVGGYYIIATTDKDGKIIEEGEENRYYFDINTVLGDLSYEQDFESLHHVDLKPMSHGYYLNKGEAFVDHEGVTIYTGDFYLITDEIVAATSSDGYNLNRDENEKVVYSIYFFDPLSTFDSSQHKDDAELYYHTKLNVELNKQWKYLLKEGVNTNGTNKYRFDYSVATEMDALTNNMANNVQKATMRELSEDELIKIDESLLDDPVLTDLDNLGIKLQLSFLNEYNNPDDLTIGDLTIGHMLEYNLTVVNAIANFDLDSYIQDHRSDIISDYNAPPFAQ